MRQRLFRMVSGLMLAVAAVAASALGAWAQGANVAHLVPEQISFATEFAQRLSDGGWTVQKVALSKFNGGFFGPTKAAWIKTDRGVLEVVYFDNPEELDAVRLRKEDTGNPKYHKYTIILVKKTERMEGSAQVFFTKYQDKLIITYDNELNDALNSLLN